MIDHFLRAASFATSSTGSIERFFINHHLPETPGFFFEVGAVNGFHLSQTAALENSHGWDGILVEGHPKLFDRLARGERQATCVRAIVGDGSETFFEAKSTGMIGHSQTFDEPGLDRFPCKTTTIEEILEDENAPDLIDYMIIDVEGSFREAWNGIDFSRRRITFLAIEMKFPDPEILEAMDRLGYDLLQIQRGEDHLFLLR